MRLHQLVGMDPAKTVVPFINTEIVSYGQEMNISKEHAGIFWEKLTTNTQKSSDFNL